MPHVAYVDKESGKEWLSGSKISSIINKPELNIWRGAIGNKKADKILSDANKIGQEFHEIIQQYLEDSFVGHEVYNEKALEMANKVYDWCNKNKLKVITLEKEVKHQELRYNGTLDGVVKIEDHPYIVDWKTSNRIDKTVVIQLCAYLMALDSMMFPEKFPVNDGLIVNINKKTLKVKEFYYPNLRQYSDIVLSCLKLWNFIQE